MAYTFRNRFKLPEADQLDADVREIKLADSTDDGLVILKPATPGMSLISEAGELALQGSGYVDADAAVAAGRKWRQYLTVALARDCIGVDFGPDDQVKPIVDMVYEDDPPELFQKLAIKVGDRIIADDYRLFVFLTDPIPRFVNFQAGTPTVKISGWLERFEQKIDEARRGHHQQWNNHKTMAYRLVRLALNDSNPETKHIQLVTAVEVVLKHQDRPKNILDALDKLLAEVESWSHDPAVKKRIKEILGENKKEESIMRAGSEQVAAMLEGTYNEKPAGKFFKDIYNMRSGLVHREKPGKPRPTIDGVRKIAAELQRFVLDLLDAYEAA